MSKQHEGHLLVKIGQYALITNSKNEILLLERAKSKKWSLPGGRIDEGDDWEESLIKETKEETGLEISDPRPFAAHIIKDPYQIKYCVYFAVTVSDLATLEIRSEHGSYKWFGVEDLQGIVIDDEPKIGEVISDYLRSLQTR